MKKLISLTAVFILSCAVFAAHHETREVSPGKVVTQAYATFSTGDNEAWSKLHTKDLQFTVVGNLPTSGTYTGTDAVIKGVFEKIPTLWRNFNLEEVERYVVGDTIFVLLAMTADGLNTRSVHMFKVRNGKISSFTAFDDTGSMLAAMVD